jgi:hypothetical protein
VVYLGEGEEVQQLVGGGGIGTGEVDELLARRLEPAERRAGP